MARMADGGSWVERDAAVVWHGFTQMSAYADNFPVVVDRAEGHYLYDTDGNRYLDFLGGIAVSALGHGHPALVEAVTDQLSTLGHVSNFFATEPQVALADGLKATYDFFAGQN